MSRHIHQSMVDAWCFREIVRLKGQDSRNPVALFMIPKSMQLNAMPCAVLPDLGS
jgi:hypothetical protein